MHRLHKLLRRAEQITLAIFLSALILLSCLQIILRLFFNSGFDWADPLLRHLVVWCGLLGALLGITETKHINIDMVQNLLPNNVKRILRALIFLFCAVICTALSFAAYRFLLSEVEFGGPPFLSLPSWIWNGLYLPVFVLMAVRFFLHFTNQLRLLFFTQAETQ